MSIIISSGLTFHTSLSLPAAGRTRPLGYNPGISAGFDCITPVVGRQEFLLFDSDFQFGQAELKIGSGRVATLPSLVNVTKKKPKLV